MNRRIDLGELTHGRSILLSGHERGVSARALYNLDSLESDDAVVSIVAPENLDAITTSFVQGMFGDTMQRYGSIDAILSKYDISELGLALQRDIRIGLSRLSFKR